MNGFIGNTPPAPEPNIAIDDFYPALSPRDFRAGYRVDSSYQAESLRRALTDAIVDVTDDLSAWATAQKAAGYATLAAVPSAQMSGNSRRVILFERAVFCFAKAHLIDTYRDVDTTRELGNDRASDHELSSDHWRREGRAAIHKMLSRPTVEAVLI